MQALLVKVIDEHSPFFGLVCTVEHKTTEGLYAISEKGASWHSGYVSEGQIRVIPYGTREYDEALHENEKP